MSSNVQVAAPKGVVDMIQHAKANIQTRLPATIDKERFFMGILTAVQKSKATAAPGKSLADCDPNSILLAAYDAAEVGCSLSPALALGWIIPYGKEAQFQPSYRFFIQKAYETNEVKTFYAEVVYAGDMFERVYAPRRILNHGPGDGNERTRKTAVGAYALIEFTDGTFDWEYLTADQIERHRNHSKNQNSMKWVQFWEEGWRITPIRVLAKRLPLKNRNFEGMVEMINKDADRDLVIPVDQIMEPTTPRQVAKVTQPIPEDVDPADRGPQQPQQTQQAQQAQTAKVEPKEQEPPQKQEPKQNGGDKATQPTGTMFAGDEQDPFLSSEEIKDFWDKTFNVQWKKNQTIAFLKEHFKVDGPRDLRRSQLPSVLAKITEARE